MIQLFARQTFIELASVALFVACGCNGRVTSNGPGTEDSATETTTDSAPFDCCSFDPPSCGCVRIGGSLPCGATVCGAADFTSGVDSRGCFYLRPGARACEAMDTGPSDVAPETAPTPDGGLDVGPPLDAGPIDKSVGKSCSTDDDCDVTFSGINRCTGSLYTAGGLTPLFEAGTIYPTPVCFGLSCTLGTGTGPTMCDGGMGVCVAVTGGAYCFPYCTFDDTGAAVKGCNGKDACRAYRWSTSPSGKTTGVGVCFGGCVTDSDCTKGDHCQLETSLCVKATVTYVKKVGDACDKSDTLAKPPTCDCIYSATGVGYCTRTCRVAVDACPAGFTCDPQLAKSDFATAPSGIWGWCLRNCASDADCTGLGAKCLESASIGRKTCQVGIPSY
jgi:hypothetical protein